MRAPKQEGTRSMVKIKKSKPLPEAMAQGASDAPATIKSNKPKKNGHAKALPVMLDLNQPGRLRVGHMMTLLSVSHAGIYSRLREKKLPPMDGHDGKRGFWKTSTVKKFLEA